MKHTIRRTTPLGAHLMRQVAVEAPADPRTIRRVLRGEPVSPMAHDRVLRALRARGLAHLVPQASCAESSGTRLAGGDQ